MQPDDKKDFSLRFTTLAARTGLVTGVLLYPSSLKKYLAWVPSAPENGLRC
jgi:hypothetical protein